MGHGVWGDEGAGEQGSRGAGEMSFSLLPQSPMPNAPI